MYEFPTRTTLKAREQGVDSTYRAFDTATDSVWNRINKGVRANHGYCEGEILTLIAAMARYQAEVHAGTRRRRRRRRVKRLHRVGVSSETNALHLDLAYTIRCTALQLFEFFVVGARVKDQRR